MLSGTYDAALIAALALGQVPRGRFISHQVITDVERPIAVADGSSLPAITK